MTTLPVVSDHLLVLLLAILCILGQLPDAFTADLFNALLPEQPHLLLILLRLHRVLPEWCSLDLKS